MFGEETLRHWSECQANHKEEGKEKHSTVSQNGTKSDWGFQRRSESGSKKREPQKRSGRIVTHPLSGSQWNRGHFCMKKWESEKHICWGACGWFVVQLDYGDELGPLRGMFGSMAAYHQQGGADGLLMPSQKSDRTHQGACRQQRNC